MTRLTPPAPTRHVASMRPRMLPAELERLAWQLRTNPQASSYTTISESSGAVRYLTHEEAEWLLRVTGVRA